ncbi:MAG: hypothetical protein P8J70_12940 [Glaciecola sp.]|jgi:hypothetical protein|nr:hypothetical protein [Glaciecola sp.]MDG2100567.1 hypothetical protein [Glaciecola sp.]
MLYFMDVMLLLGAPVLAFIFGVLVVMVWRFLPKQPLYSLQHYLLKLSNVH